MALALNNLQKVDMPINKETKPNLKDTQTHHFGRFFPSNAPKKLYNIRCCFWSTVSKCGTHFEHSFLLDKCSCKMVNILPSDIFNSSTISGNFNLRSAETNLWSFLVLSGKTAEFRQPERSALFMSVLQRLKSEYHLLTVVFDGAESLWHLSSHCFAWTVFFPVRKQCFIKTRIQIFPLFWKFATLSK